MPFKIACIVAESDIRGAEPKKDVLPLGSALRHPLRVNSPSQHAIPTIDRFAPEGNEHDS
ncbi:hypothetical protein OAZ24_00495 [Synechococcus sp. AH-736-G21]|nr:hypothetical protein [Synechococcus sp. AH-736-G21]